MANTSGSSTESINRKPSDNLRDPVTGEILLKDATAEEMDAEGILHQKEANRRLETNDALQPSPLPNDRHHVIVLDFDENPKKNMYKKAIYRAKKSASHTASFLIIIHTMLIVQLFNTLPTVLKCSYKALSLGAMSFPAALSLGKLVLINLDYLRAYAKLDEFHDTMILPKQLKRRAYKRHLITWTVIALLFAYAVFIACGTTDLICTLPPTPSPAPQLSSPFFLLADV